MTAAACVLRGTLEITGGATDLSPLECLTTIDGGLVIRENPALRDLDGLRSLESAPLGSSISTLCAGSNG